MCPQRVPKLESEREREREWRQRLGVFAALDARSARSPSRFSARSLCGCTALACTRRLIRSGRCCASRTRATPRPRTTLRSRCSTWVASRPRPRAAATVENAVGFGASRRGFSALLFGGDSKRVARFLRQLRRPFDRRDPFGEQRETDPARSLESATRRLTRGHDGRCESARRVSQRVSVSIRKSVVGLSLRAKTTLLSLLCAEANLQSHSHCAICSVLYESRRRTSRRSRSSPRTPRRASTSPRCTTATARSPT